MATQGPITQAAGEFPRLAMDSASRLLGTLEDFLVLWPNEETENRSFVRIHGSEGLTWPIDLPIFPWHTEKIPSGPRILLFQNDGPSDPTDIPLLPIKTTISFVDSLGGVGECMEEQDKSVYDAHSKKKQDWVRISVTLGAGTTGEQCTHNLETTQIVGDNGEIKNIDLIPTAIASCGIALALRYVRPSDSSKEEVALPLGYDLLTAASDATSVSCAIQGIGGYHAYIRSLATDAMNSGQSTLDEVSARFRGKDDFSHYLRLHTLLNRVRTRSSISHFASNREICAFTSDKDRGLFSRAPFAEGSWVKALAIDACPTSTAEERAQAWKDVESAGKNDLQRLQARSQAALAQIEKGVAQYQSQNNGALKASGKLIKEGIDAQIALVNETARNESSSEAQAGLNLGAAASFFLLAQLSSIWSQSIAHAVALPSSARDVRAHFAEIPSIFEGTSYEGLRFPTDDADITACTRHDAPACESLRKNTRETLRLLEEAARERFSYYLLQSLRHYATSIADECMKIGPTSKNPLPALCGDRGGARENSKPSSERTSPLNRLMEDSAAVAAVAAAELCREHQFERGRAVLAPYLETPETRQTALAGYADCEGHELVRSGLGHRHPAESLAWIYESPDAEAARNLVKRLRALAQSAPERLNFSMASTLTIAYYAAVWPAVYKLSAVHRGVLSTLEAETRTLDEKARMRPRREPVDTTIEDLKALWDVVIPPTTEDALRETDAMVLGFGSPHESLLVNSLNEARQSYVQWVEDPLRKPLEHRKDRIVLRRDALNTIRKQWLTLERNAIASMIGPLSELERFAGVLPQPSANVRGSSYCEVTFVAAVATLRLAGFVKTLFSDHTLQFPELAQYRQNEDQLVDYLLDLVNNADRKEMLRFPPHAGLYTAESEQKATGRESLETKSKLLRETQGNSCPWILQPRLKSGIQVRGVCPQRFANNMLYDIDWKRLESSPDDVIRDDLRDIGRAYMRWRDFSGVLPNTAALALWSIAQEDWAISGVDLNAELGVYRFDKTNHRDSFDALAALGRNTYLEYKLRRP